jgi:hypothetical protein
MSLSRSKTANVRAAAILTNAAVASSSISLPATNDQSIMLFCDFTVGSLTNVIITPQVSYDGTNWFDMTDPGALTLTATGKKSIPLRCQGAKMFRATATGTGTVTSSSLQLDVGLRIY